MKRAAFSTKIVIAAASVEILGSGCFALINDQLQQQSVSDNLPKYMADVVESTAENISQWIMVRTELLKNAAELAQKQSRERQGFQGD